jgi:hypothetical protein
LRCLPCSSRSASNVCSHCATSHAHTTKADCQ